MKYFCEGIFYFFLNTIFAMVPNRDHDIREVLKLSMAHVC